MKPTLGRGPGWLRRLPGALLAAGPAVLAWSAYRQDLLRARARIAAGQILQTAAGAIEYGEHGQGPAVLVVHGAGGGFDQGLELASFLTPTARVLAPSRFGYLGTPLPADGTPAAQADAHAALLDRLRIEQVAVLGASAGALSALAFALRHPARTRALVLLVPALWHPGLPAARPSPATAFLLDTALRSDLLFWVAQRCARDLLMRGVLATPPALWHRASVVERERIERVLEQLQPVSARRPGLLHDADLLAAQSRAALEQLSVPCLLISARDDLFGTAAAAAYCASQIPGARLRLFDSGGHLLVGRTTAVQAEISAFLRGAIRPSTR